MLNKTSMLLAAAVVALSAGAASADPSDRFGHYDQTGGDPYANNDDQGRSAYGNGYNYGYDDGYARHNRDDRFRAEAYRGGSNSAYQRGANYYGSDCNGNAAAGAILGAIAGGAIGNGLGHGGGGATLAGVILGGMAGNSIARDMDCSDRRYAMSSYSAGFEGRIGERHNWRNADNRNYGSFTPVREYRRNGNTCRDFREVSTRRGRDYVRNGTACRRNDGNWYME